MFSSLLFLHCRAELRACPHQTNPAKAVNQQVCWKLVSGASLSHSTAISLKYASSSRVNYAWERFAREENTYPGSGERCSVSALPTLFLDARFSQDSCSLNATLKKDFTPTCSPKSPFKSREIGRPFRGYLAEVCSIYSLFHCIWEINPQSMAAIRQY